MRNNTPSKVISVSVVLFILQGQQMLNIHTIYMPLEFGIINQHIDKKMPDFTIATDNPVSTHLGQKIYI